MKIQNEHLAIVAFIAVLASIIHGKYNVFFLGIIAYSLTAIIGIAGVFFIFTSVKQFKKEMEESSSFTKTEAVFIRSEEASLINEKFAAKYKEVILASDRKSYKYIYEYYVNGERYEYTTPYAFYFSEIPKYNEKKRTVAYNPEKPGEVSEINDELIDDFRRGPICIIFTIFILILLRSN